MNLGEIKKVRRKIGYQTIGTSPELRMLVSLVSTAGVRVHDMFSRHLVLPPRRATPRCESLLLWTSARQRIAHRPCSGAASPPQSSGTSPAPSLVSLR